jgi:hypothetical protein
MATKQHNKHTGSEPHPKAVGNVMLRLQSPNLHNRKNDSINTNINSTRANIKTQGCEDNIFAKTGLCLFVIVALLKHLLT